MNTEQLKDCFRDDPETMLDAIGIEYKLKSGRLNILCPFHADKNLGSCVVKHGGFNCFACGTHGDLLDLTQEVCNASFFEAVEIASKAYGLTISFERKSESEKRLFLNKEEKEALAFPSTSIGLGKVMRTDENQYKKIVLSQAAKKIAEYRNLDNLYGSRDADEAYIFGEYCSDVSPKTFDAIHRVLNNRIKVLLELEKRF